MISNCRKRRERPLPMLGRQGDESGRVVYADPDHLILMSDSESNVLEGSSIWEGVAGEERSNLPDDNEAFTAWGKLSVMEQLAHEILQKINVSKGLDFF